MEVTPGKCDLKLKLQEKKLPMSTGFQPGAILLPPPYPRAFGNVWRHFSWSQFEQGMLLISSE